MVNKLETGLLEYVFDRKHLIIIDVNQSDLLEAEEIFREHHSKRVLEKLEENKFKYERGEKTTLCYIIDSEILPNILKTLCEYGIVSRIANASHRPYSLRSKISNFFFNFI